MLSKDIDKIKQNSLKVSTDTFKVGLLLLDLVVGGKKGVLGFPYGKFINIVGDKSSGKSFLCSEIISTAYHTLGDKFKWVYDDCESGYSFDTEELYGFNIMQNLEHSATVETAFCNISKFAKELKKDMCGIYVLDSLDGLTSSEQDERAKERIKAFENDKSYDKGSYGMGKQKYLSQEFFPQLCSLIEQKNILVIIVSQIRDNVDSFSFEKYSRSGGKALDFYSHTVLWLVNVKKIMKKERSVGVIVRAKTTKSKTPRPYRDCMFSLLYDYGLDDTGSNVDYLYNLRTNTGELSANSKIIRWNEGEKISLSAVKKFLTETENIDNFQTSKFYDGRITLDSVLEFISSNKDIKNKFDEKFGGSMDRDSLIKYIEENNLESELRKKVEDKWEAFENEIKSDRKKRYGDI